MEIQEQYDTLTEAIAALREQGYVEDFNLQTDCIECRQGEFQLHPEDFQIDKFFRFYGFNDPGDESVVYAISSGKYPLRGVLVNGYGMTSETLSAEMMAKLV